MSNDPVRRFFVGICVFYSRKDISEGLYFAESIHQKGSAVPHEQMDEHQVAAYLAGKTALSEWFLGQVMKATQGKAAPAAVRLELDRALGELEEHQSGR